MPESFKRNSKEESDWELMVGNSNCRWHWLSGQGNPEPSIPWCGFYYPDGTSVSIAETEAIKRYTTDSFSNNNVLFDDFQDGNYNGWTVNSGTWLVTSNGNIKDLNVSSGNGDKKILAGSTWTDYTIQGTVRLADSNNIGAGFLVNANDTGTTGYYCEFLGVIWEFPSIP